MNYQRDEHTACYFVTLIIIFILLRLLIQDLFPYADGFMSFIQFIVIIILGFYLNIKFYDFIKTDSGVATYKFSKTAISNTFKVTYKTFISIYNFTFFIIKGAKNARGTFISFENKINKRLYIINDNFVKLLLVIFIICWVIYWVKRPLQY